MNRKMQMKRKTLIGVILMSLLSSGIVSEAAKVEIQTLFEKPVSQGEYRIPGILALQNGTLVVTCGDRKGQGDFGHDTTNVIRRSTDGGNTWKPEQVITAKAGIDIHNGPMVQDRETGKIFKFCRYWPGTKDGKNIVRSWNYERMAKKGFIDFVQTSCDSGKSWTDPQILSLPYPENVTSAATGNGVHGIQLQNGQLVIQGGYNVMRDGKPARQCCTFTCNPDGNNWQRLSDFDTANLKIVREFVIAEKQNGEIYHNFRSVLGNRWTAVGKGELAEEKQLPDVECHAGLGVWRRDGECPVWFFSHPSPVGKAREGNFSQRRQRLVLRISRDEGKTWGEEILIHEKAAAYSDVAVLPDGTVFVVFENGDRIGHPYQRVSVARVQLE